MEGKKDWTTVLELFAEVAVMSAEKDGIPVDFNLEIFRASLEAVRIGLDDSFIRSEVRPLIREALVSFYCALAKVNKPFGVMAQSILTLFDLEDLHHDLKRHVEGGNRYGTV